MYPHDTNSLFARIGGITVVNDAVDIFYGKLIADARVARFFERMDLNKQSGKMKVFLACALGAPIGYTGRSMKEAHAHMHLTEEHFNAVAEHLESTLVQLHVDRTLIDEVMRVAHDTKSQIIAESHPA